LAVVIVLLTAGLILSGCGKGRQHHKARQEPENPSVAERPRSGTPARSEIAGALTLTGATNQTPGDTDVAGLKPLFAPVAPPEASPQEKYDAALLDALNLMAERRHAKALTALEAARALQDTEQVRQQIERLKVVIDRQAAVDRLAQDIQTVLDAGKPDEAARLATGGLQQYGDTDAADRLIQLKRQADALLAAQVSDRTADRNRLRQEAEAALAAKNLPAAALAYDQALQYGGDPALRRQRDDCQDTLGRYNECRRRAADLRRDPANLEDALAALQEAARAWDTPQVRQEIDEYTLALQKRRDRLSVADFEVRGEVGIPVAGRVVAEELLPGFKPRFDLVERSQLAQVLGELKLEATDLAANEPGRREAGRLARVRYLVLGSVTAYNGITVNARLVDVPSGLIVQTAQVVARTPEEMRGLLPQLANLLMMTDAQKMAYEQQQAQQVPLVPVVPEAPLPPPPEVGQPAPPPLVVYSPRPPDLGGLRPQDFEQIPPVVMVPAPAVVLVEREDPVKQRLVSVSVELGDNLFRRGRYKEAHAQFELALSLAPHHTELSLRIERCRPHLPPPPPPPPPPAVVVVTPAPPPVVIIPVARPRIAVMNFVVNADPGRVPAAFGDWASEQIASYFNPMYEIVDRGEVCWYMGRLGITMRDVLANPSARVCLGRALNVRFFVFGAIQQTASFDVSTHMVDVETGGKQGGGKIHVQDHQELKLRLGELVKQTAAAAPAEQQKLQQEAQDSERVVTQARQLLQKGQAAEAAAVARDGLNRHPGHPGIQAILQQAEQQEQQAKLEAKRQQELKQQQAQAAALQRRQQELAREAEAARQQAQKLAAARSEAERRTQEQQKQRAYDELFAKGQTAVQQGNYPQAIQLLQSAVALKPTGPATQALAQAKAKADEAARAKVAQEKAAKEAAERRQREAELARARQQVEEDKKKRAAEDLARRKAQEARDQAAYNQYLGEGRQLLAQGKPDGALARFQSARQIQATDEVKKLITQAQDQLVEAQKKAVAARGAAETEQRKKAEEQQRALDEEKRKKAEEQQRALEVQRLIKEGQTALAAKQFDNASKAFSQAAKLMPGNAEAQVGLAQTEKARQDSLAQSRRQQDDQARLAKYRTALEMGRAHLAAKRYDAAVAALTEATKLNPGDPAAAAALKEAEAGRAGSQAESARQVTQKQNAEAYQKWMADGRAALAGQRYDAAIQAFREAQKLQPTDPAAAAALKQAELARDSARTAADAAARQKLEEAQRAERVRQLLAAGRSALSAQQFEAAGKAFADARQLAPADPNVARALQDLDQARRTAAANVEAEKKKRLQEYQQAMTTGRQMLTARRFDEAARAFTDAGRLQPGDPQAAAMLREVDKARAAAAQTQAAQEAEARRRQQEEQARRNEFNRQMALGKAAMTAKRYDDAVKAFTEALKYQPGNAEATKALHDADQAAKAAKNPAPMPPRK
jgi:tetratricopeptide (TPR) repeat protein